MAYDPDEPWDFGEGIVSKQTQRLVVFAGIVGIIILASLWAYTSGKHSGFHKGFAAAEKVCRIGRGDAPKQE